MEAFGLKTARIIITIRLVRKIEQHFMSTRLATSCKVFEAVVAYVNHIVSHFVPQRTESNSGEYGLLQQCLPSTASGVQGKKPKTSTTSDMLLAPEHVYAEEVTPTLEIIAHSCANRNCNVSIFG